jgi:hypothetical protein
MTSDRIIVEALKLAHRLLCPNPHLRGTGTVLRLREVVHSPSVRSALERGSDSLPAFALRETARVLSDFSQTPGETIVRIRHVLDDPHLRDALGLGQNVASSGYSDQTLGRGGGNEGVFSSGRAN